jgi:hypothetical protein
VNEDFNYCFGEGGRNLSDGKNCTRDLKSVQMLLAEFLELFVALGFRGYNDRSTSSYWDQQITAKSFRISERKLSNGGQVLFETD